MLWTRRVAEAGEVVGITLIDHLIVGRGGEWFSFKERGGWTTRYRARLDSEQIVEPDLGRAAIRVAACR